MMGVLESAAAVLILTMPGTPPARHGVVVSERIYLATMAGDVGTTYYGLSTRQMKERNPILRPFQHQPALVAAAQAGMVVGYVWIARKVGRAHPRVAAALHLALTLVNVANTVNNVRIVDDYQKRLARRAREQM